MRPSLSTPSGSANQPGVDNTISADDYAEDAVETIELAQQLLGWLAI